MRDTTPDAEEKMREMIRSKLPSDRLKMGWSMYETSKLLVLRAIVEKDPTISESDLRKEFFLRFYGDDFDLKEHQKILAHLEQYSSNVKK